jgi:O-antigen ligase
VWVLLIISVLILIFAKTKISKKIIYFSLFVLAFLLLFPFIKERWADIFQKGSYSSWDWRVDLWKNLIKNFEIENIFIGNGLGMFEYEIGVPAHNDYIRTLYEAGILGLLSYIFLLFYILYTSFKKMFWSKIIFEINKYKIATCLVVSLLIGCFSCNLLRSLIVLFYYFITISLFLNFSDNSY